MCEPSIFVSFLFMMLLSFEGVLRFFLGWFQMQGIHTVPADFVEKQMLSVLTDIGADVVRF
jgi:hypothetical protein